MDPVLDFLRGVIYGWIPPGEATKWFCSVLHTASYHTGSLSQYLPPQFSLTCSDLVDLVIFLISVLLPWVNREGSSTVSFFVHFDVLYEVFNFEN